MSFKACFSKKVIVISALAFLLSLAPIFAFGQETKVIITEPLPLPVDLTSPLPIPVEVVSPIPEPVVEECPRASFEEVVNPCTSLVSIPENPKDEEVLTESSVTLHLPVNAFDNGLTGWTKTGTSPYLGILDYSANYISCGASGSTGYYDFKDVIGDITDLGTITKVELRVYQRQTGSIEYSQVNAYVRNGTLFYALSTYVGHSSWSVDTKDITSTSGLDTWTWTAVNNTQIYFLCTLDVAIPQIDYAELQVTYTPYAETIPDYTDTFDYWSSTMNIWLGLIFLLLLILIILSSL